MPNVDRNAVLNRLLQIHTSSLPMYLANARPWTPRDRQRETDLLQAIIDDQQRMIGRITEDLLDSGGDIAPGEFPMEYTDVHDLSIDYAIKALVEAQRRDVAAIEDCVRQSGGDPLAQEALGAAKGHLESLEEVTAHPAGA